jgi:hypothetical protein
MSTSKLDADIFVCVLIGVTLCTSQEAAREVVFVSVMFEVVVSLPVYIIVLLGGAKSRIVLFSPPGNI